MKTPKELREERVTIINNARAILNKADEEKRQPTAEERQQYDKMMEDVARLKTEIETLEGDLRRKTDLETVETELKESASRQIELTSENKAAKNQEKEQRIFELKPSISGDTRNILLAGEKATAEYGKNFRAYLLGGQNIPEARALQKDSDIAGGFLSPPLQFMAELIQAVDNLAFMRQICRVLPPITSAESLGAPSLDADPADPTWTAEIAVGSEDSTMTFGKRELTPHPLAQYIKVSRTLLRRSAIGVDAIVRDRLAYKFGVVEENNFLNGSGSNAPLGVFTASDYGISTSRDISTDNTTSAMTFNGLKEVKYTLKPQYWKNARWIFHRDGQKQFDKIKDGDGQYIWHASVVEGEPDRLLNFPIYLSEYAPNTFETGLYVGILGDFSKYWIVDALTMSIQVILELYAATNQNAYFGRLECDGMPVIEEAFVRVTLG